MHRCSSGFFLTIAITFALALTGCLGKSTPGSETGGVRNVSLNPASNFSLEVGGKQVFSATATDANGRPLVGLVQFLVASGTPGVPAPLSVASNGNACAGTWDPQVAMCSPGTSGIALVTAIVNGVQSAPTTVYVHNHIARLQVMPAQQRQPPYDCFSQGQTWLYQGVAYDNQDTDITNTVGELSWASTNAGVLRTATLLPQMPLNQVQITAESPGITQLYASVSGTTSNTLPITTCLVQYVRLRTQGFSGSSVSVNTGSPVTLLATAVDTLGYTLAKPPLTWSTNNPEVVSFTTLTSSTGTNTATARSNLGDADVTASCTPPTCNIGIAGYQDPQGRILTGLPVYASGGQMSPTNPQLGYGAISVQVTTTSNLPTYLGWAATGISPVNPNGGCNNAPGCQSVMFQITPGANNPISATATVPRTPNSLMFNDQTRAYLGSNQGLMFIDTGGTPVVNTVSNSTTPCNVALCGKVLAISPDGKQVVVSDDVSATPQVYIYSSGTSSSTDLVLPNVATAAAFSPDQSKLFILTDVGTMYVYSTVDALAPVPIPTSGTDVAFSADGSFAYVAGATGAAGAVSAFSTCSLPGVPSTELNNGTPVPTAGVPLQIFPSPNVQANADFITQNVFVLEPPNVQVLTAQYTQTNILDGQFTCNPPTVTLSSDPSKIFNLGQGAFTPLYARLVGDGSELIVVAQNIPAVLIFNFAYGTTQGIHLGNLTYPDSYPLAASSSSDGSQFYVAACDQYPNNDSSQPCSAGSVHVVTLNQGDYLQVPYINNTTNNMCNNLGGSMPLCVANLVGIKPQ